MQFAFFVLTFLTVYGGMNAYVFVKARAAMSLGLKGGIILGLWFVLMIFAPILVRLSERYGLDPLAHILSWVGYYWFGFVFLFISVGVLFDIWRFGLYVWSVLARSDISSLLPGAKLNFYIPVAWGVLILFLGSFSAWDIQTEQLTIRTSKLPPGVDHVRVAQITDVHIGLIVREGRVRAIMEKVREARPDILVSTGDLVDGQIDDISTIANLFNSTPPRWGMFAITGNHEYYAGLKHALEFTRQAGFTMLRGQAVEAGPIMLAGVDYPSDWTKESVNVDEENLLSGLPKDRFILLLKHVPLTKKKSIGLFDLQLSGHTHKGQIFPFGLVVRFPYPRIAGYYDLGSGSALYTSRGSGTWGPPVRFLSPPEVTIIDIVKG